jgi:hypothetical protein
MDIGQVFGVLLDVGEHLPTIATLKLFLMDQFVLLELLLGRKHGLTGLAHQCEISVLEVGLEMTE